MKRILILFVVLVFCIGSVNGESGERKKRVFIKFLSSNNIKDVSVGELKILGEALDSRIAKNLDKSRYRVMSKRDVKVMLPPGVSIEDCDDKCDVELGRSLDVDLMISMKMNSGFGKYFIYIDIVDTKSAEVLNKITISAKNSENGLESLFKKIEVYDFKNYLLEEKINIYEEEEEVVEEERKELIERLEERKIEIDENFKENKEIEVDDLFSELLSLDTRKVSQVYVDRVSRLISRRFQRPSNSGRKVNIDVLVFLDRKGHINEYYFKNYEKDDKFKRSILKTIEAFSFGKSKLPLPEDEDDKNAIWTRGINLMFSF